MLFQLAPMVGVGTGCLEHCLDGSALRGDALGDVEQLGLSVEARGRQEWVLTTPRGVSMHLTSHLTRALSSSLPSCCWQPSRLVLLLLS